MGKLQIKVVLMTMISVFIFNFQDVIDEPKKIQITNLPVIINQDMLKMFFENKTDFGENIIEISIKDSKAIVEFDESTGKKVY
jgi:hypothetical protein